MQRRILLVGLAVVGMLFCAAAAPAAEELLKLTPANALGLLVINRPAAVDAKLQTLASKMQLPTPGLLAMVKPLLGVHEGWDENGSLGVLILPSEDGSPIPLPIILVPVTDYVKFVKQLQAEDASQAVTKIKLKQKEFCARHIGGYAALTGVQSRAVLESKLALSPEIPPALKPWRGWLTGKDAAGLILSSGIKEILSKAQLALQVTKMALAAQSNEQAKAAAGMFDVYGRALQALEKQAAGFGFDLQLDGRHVLRLGSRTLFAPGGTLARLATQSRPAQVNLLAGLPAGPFVAAGGGAVSGAAMEEVRKWSFEMMRSVPDLYKITPEQSEKMAAISMEAMRGVHSFSMMLGADQPDQATFANAIGVMGVDQASAFMTAYEQQMRKYSALLADLHSPILQPPAVEKCEVGGLAALQLTTKVPLPQDNLQTPQQTQMLKGMFGPDAKVVAWIAPADDHHVVIGYVNQKNMQRSIDVLRKGQPGLAGDAGVAKTAALLPAKALAIGFVSPAGVLGFVQRMAAAALPPEAKVKVNLPSFPPTPPLGFALTTSANEVQTCLVVPAEVLQAAGAYVGKIRAQHGAAKPETK